MHTQKQDCAAPWRNSPGRTTPQSSEAQGEPLGRLNSQTIAREILGAIETTLPLAQLELRILLRNITGLSTTFGRTHRNRQNARRGDVDSKNIKELLNWHACKLDLGGDVRWAWPGPCAAWNFFIQEGMRESGVESTTTTGCVLGV